MAKYCSNCGAELKENQDVCLNCGRIISVSKEKTLPKKKKKSYADISLTLGLLSFFAWLLPILGYPVTICAIVYGSRGLKEDSENERARLGRLFGIIFLIITLANSILGIFNYFYGAIPYSYYR